MNERGQTLIEVVVALVLLGLIVTSVYMALNIGLRATGIVNERTTAESLTRSELESIKNCDYVYWDYDADTGNSTPPDYGNGAGNGTVRPVAAFPGYNISSIAVPINPEIPEHVLFFDPETHAPVLDADTGDPLFGDRPDHGMQQITVSVYFPSGLVLTTESYKVNR